MPFDLDGWELDVNATQVDLSESDITSDDLTEIVERLKTMPNLVSLNLGGGIFGSGNHITSIESLAALVNLTYLDLSWNQITSIEGLSGLVGLTSLQLQYNQITSIEGLSELVGLTKLYLYGNQITSVEELSGLVNLTYLDLDEGVADPHQIVHRNKLRSERGGNEFGGNTNGTFLFLLFLILFTRY